MTDRIEQSDLEAIEQILASHPHGLGLGDIRDALGQNIHRNTLLYRLKQLQKSGRITGDGRRPATYKLAGAEARRKISDSIELSDSAQAIRSYVTKPLSARRHVGYDRTFLDSYRPNKTFYLSKTERQQLRQLGEVVPVPQPAGTYARQILNRLLIDLSWNSSRLEGNSYSLLDSKRLIEFGKEARGKDRLDAQMILNHKDAIEFLVEMAEEIQFNRYTILNLHGILANNLLSDPTAAGRLRRIEVGIGGSNFQPLLVPQLIEECFEQILDTANVIKDPFEQSFFVMVHLPYLQPFEDVNKRVSRLAANIPFIKNNLLPLAFIEVPKDLYTLATLGVYELNKVEFLKEVYLWSYRRSVERYAAVRQSLGEPDPFRLKYRDELRQIVRNVVIAAHNRKRSYDFFETWVEKNISEADREKFREVAETEVLSLHEGNFARYQIRPSEFEAWKKIWDAS